MTKYKDEDLIGKRFGKLLVIDIIRTEKGRFCVCKCDCGGESKVLVRNLIIGHTGSCGCIRRKKYTKEELNLHKRWKEIIRRCYSEKYEQRQYYYDKGITVCDEWLNDKDAFTKWSLENGYRKDFSIDRIDSTKGYSPENCRWVDYHIQEANREYKINFSGYTGVYKSKAKIGWYSSINVNKKHYHIGSFKSKREAVEARNNFIIKNGLTEYKIQEWKGE